MKYMLSAMFMFTALVRSSDVITCVTPGSGHEYSCIQARFDVLNDEGKVAGHGKATGVTVTDVVVDIQYQLKARQIVADYDLSKQSELRSLHSEAKTLVGREVSQ